METERTLSRYFSINFREKSMLLIQFYILRSQQKYDCLFTIFQVTEVMYFRTKFVLLGTEILHAEKPFLNIFQSSNSIMLLEVTVFQYVAPCILADCNQNLGGKWCLLLTMVYSSTLGNEATCSSETSLNFYQITRCHIPEDSNINSHSRESLISLLFEFLTAPKKSKLYY